MIAAANILTDLYLSIAALIGLAILHGALRTVAPDDLLVRRLIFALRVSMLIFAGRALVVLTGGQGFRFMVLLAASLVPLAALLVTEGLLRRHAPPFAKLLTGGGALVFGVLAVVGTAVDPAWLWGLLVFQVAGFAMSGWLIATRDRASLTAGENRMATRLGLTLVFLLPLIATDFLLVFLRLPVQISAIGVLSLCWVALGLSRAQDGHRRTFAALGIMLAASFGTGAFVALATGVGLSGAVLVIAVIMAMVLVLACAAVAREGRAQAQTETLMAHMADAEVTEPLGFLRSLQAHPLVDGAVIVEAAELDGLDRAVLDRIFAASPVLDRAAMPVLGAVADDHMAHLFARFDATHIMDTGMQPRRLVALVMPALQTSERALVELRAVQRMAALMAKAERI